jgi:hypothetical protein
MMFANILMIGGIIGAAIDTNTGAAFDYPELIKVDFGLVRTAAPAQGSAP